MIEMIRMFAAVLAAVMMTLSGTDPMLELRNTQWVNEQGDVYEFNEDARQFANFSTGFIYGRMGTGEYRQATISSDGLIYRLDDTTYSFELHGDELLFHRYDSNTLTWTQHFVPYDQTVHGSTE